MKSESIIIHHLVNHNVLGVSLGILQQLLVLLGVRLRIRANHAEEFDYRSNVLLGFRKCLRPADCYTEEEEISEAKINPGDVEVSVNVDQLVTGLQSFDRLVLVG